MKRQPTIQKEDQATIRQIVHHFIPELFFSQPPEHNISEESTDEDRENHQGQNLDTPELRKKHVPGPPSSPLETKATFCDVTAAEPHNTLDDVYSLFFVNNNWYFFLRLHQTLCSRLLKIYRQAQKQLLEYRTEKEREKLLCEGRKEKTNDPAMELRLKQPSKNNAELSPLLMPWLPVLHCVCLSNGTSRQLCEGCGGAILVFVSCEHSSFSRAVSVSWAGSQRLPASPLCSGVLRCLVVGIRYFDLQCEQPHKEMVIAQGSPGSA